MVLVLGAAPGLASADLIEKTGRFGGLSLTYKVLLPPGYAGEVPEGYFVCRSGTNNVFMFFRAFYADASNLKPPVDLIEKTRIYPLHGEARPMQFPDASGVPANMLPISDASAFDALKKLVDAEGPHLADPDWMGMLAGLGIVKGEPFQPDERMRGILDRAAKSAYQMSRVIAFDEVVSGRSFRRTRAASST